MPLDTKPLVKKRDQGTSVWWSRGSIVTVKVSAKDTGDSLSLAEQTCPPRYQTPIHVHNKHDELLLAVDGRFDVYYENEHETIDPGEFVYLPKTVPHGFRNAENRVSRLHILFEPGLEKGFLEAGVPTETPVDELPEAPPEIADAEKLIDVDEVYDTEIVGELPGPEMN